MNTPLVVDRSRSPSVQQPRPRPRRKDNVTYSYPSGYTPDRTVSAVDLCCTGTALHAYFTSVFNDFLSAYFM
jgi:hypothetical protein